MDATGGVSRSDDGGGPQSSNWSRTPNYLIRGLIDFDDVSYDDHAELLYRLAGQVVAKLRSYLTSDDDLHNVLRYYQQQLVNLIHSQMEAHYEEDAIGYKATMTRGFTTLRPKSPSFAQSDNAVDFRNRVPKHERIRLMLFTGWTKGLYAADKFDSDSERLCAVIVDKSRDVQKWFRPSRGDFRIYHSKDEEYVPDFVIETTEGKFIVEVKAKDDLDTPEVQAKAKAAMAWCEQANAFLEQPGSGNGKPWAYLLIPHDELAENMTLGSLVARFVRRTR